MYTPILIWDFFMRESTQALEEISPYLTVHIPWEKGTCEGKIQESVRSKMISCTCTNKNESVTLVRFLKWGFPKWGSPQSSSILVGFSMIFPIYTMWFRSVRCSQCHGPAISIGEKSTSHWAMVGRHSTERMNIDSLPHSKSLPSKIGTL